MKAGREHDQRNLYVLNLPLDATTEQFEKLFSQFGKVEHAVILATLDHLARRRGFILMSDASQARLAIENLNGHSWHHYRIEVSFAIVQRSGTPFSQEAPGSASDDRFPRVTMSSTVPCHTLEGGTTAQTSQLGQTHSMYTTSQTKDEATLVLSGLDTNIVSSPAMVKALVEPFGHLAELVLPQPDLPVGSDGEAVAVYCCSSSASLARLALHGLTIGKGRVHADLAHRNHGAFDAFGQARRGVDHSGDFVASYMPEASQALPGPFDSISSIGTLADSQSCRDYSGSEQVEAPRRQEQSFGAGGLISGSWQASFRSLAGTSDPRDSRISERRTFPDLPRPIGDERQRAATKKS